MAPQVATLSRRDLAGSVKMAETGAESMIDSRQNDVT